MTSTHRKSASDTMRRLEELRAVTPRSQHLESLTPEGLKNELSHRADDYGPLPSTSDSKDIESGVGAVREGNVHEPERAEFKQPIAVAKTVGHRAMAFFSKRANAEIREKESRAGELWAEEEYSRHR